MPWTRQLPTKENVSALQLQELIPIFQNKLLVFNNFSMSETITCIVADDDPLSLKVMQHFIDKTDGLTCIAYCDSAVAAANVLLQQSVDILFLDIEMPEMTGLELVRSLKTRPFIILISSKENYAAPAFDLDVTDYLVKPPDYARFLKAYHKVLDARKGDGEALSKADKLFVKSETILVGLDIPKIIMVEAMADYVRIYIGDKRHTVYSSMKGIAAKLPATLFERVHRSYIVNIGMIDTVEDNALVVAGHLVPVGVTYQKTLMARLNLL
jgi:two-component system LytT family response regulator